MASSVSLKDLSRAIHVLLSKPTLPLPDALLDAVDGYLERHESHDDASSDRLQEELAALFDKHVKANSTALTSWIAILRRLLPALQSPDRVLPLFDAYNSLLDGAGVEKLLSDEAADALVDLVAVADACRTISSDLATNPIMDRLFPVWMTRLSSTPVEGNTSHEHNERMVRQALKAFGKKRPKELFASMDGCFINTTFRHATLRFFCDFIQDQSPHLHQVLHISIFSSLLTSLVPHLPTLFNIYARLLFWDREISRASDVPSDIANQQTRGWQVCAFDPEIDDLSVPQLGNLYTVRYGLYPINFMEYIRKPQRYLRHANTSNTDEVEVEPAEIRNRSERFRRFHLLHPNFYTLTIDSEKMDFGRWIKSEAASVLVECMGLSGCR